jgi:hypothetical protein
MPPILIGLIAGSSFGIVAVALMLPLPFPDKRAALLGAFLNRFAIGVLIPLTTLPLAAWLRGLLVGLLISLPDAVITKAYLPIIGMGALGGGLIGWIVG